MKIQLISPSDGDWICLVVDNKVIEEGHSLAEFQVLDALKTIGLDIEYEQIEIDGEDKWWEWRNALNSY